MQTTPGRGKFDGTGSAAVAVVLVVALLVRLWINSHSLWYDEMYTILHFVGRPLRDIVAGEYSANNHVLSTLLIKMAAWACGGLATLDDGQGHAVLTLGTDNTLAFRLVPVLAGTMLALALAWGLRPVPALAAQTKARPSLRDWLPMVVMGMLAACHPWLASVSTEARGYALMLMLAALATNSLDAFRTRFSWGYVLAMVAAIYTLPTAGEVLLAHGAALLSLNRAGLKRWATAAVLVIAANALLYAPFLGGIRAHIGVPGHADISLAPYAASVLRHAVAGWNTGGAAAVVVAVAVLGAGSMLAWRHAALRVGLLTYGVATGLAVAGALTIGNLKWERLAVWLAPWCVLALFGLVTAAWQFVPKPAPRWAITAVLTFVALAGLLWQDSVLARIPPQPSLEALLQAGRSGGADITVVGVYMNSAESWQLYLPWLERHTTVAYNLEALQRAERAAQGRVRLVVYFEGALGQADPELATYIARHYDLAERLDGRISPALIYTPRRDIRPTAPG